MQELSVNALTVDVEDYFQVSAFESSVDPRCWGDFESRVEANTHLLLQKFSQKKVKATFFVLGWVAQRFPLLIRSIAEHGHEIASHGMLHQRATSQAPQQFYQDVLNSKLLLEDITGAPVIGYRAPSFSFDKSNLWVYDQLLRAGYRYSSSVYPVAHDHYGVPDAPRFRYQPIAGLDEIPLSTMRFCGRNLPISGGGFFRLYPYSFTRAAISRYQREGGAYTFYIHPWELDPDQPRISRLELKSQFRHYVNLSKSSERLDGLLADFSWSSMAQVHGFDRAHALGEWPPARKGWQLRSS